MKILLFIGSLTGVMLHRLIIPYHKMATLTTDLKIDYFTYTGQPNEEIAEALNDYDYFVFNRTLPEGLIEAIKKTKCKIICDCDDDWILPQSHPLYLNYLINHTTARIIKHIQLADYVTTTTIYLANKLRTLNQNVKVFGNALEQDDQFTTNKIPSDRVRFGLLGSSSHTQDMGLLQDIGNQIDNDILDRIQFVLVGFDGGKLEEYDEHGKKTSKDLQYKDTPWGEWERYFTNNYQNLSPEYTQALQRFDKIDIQSNESYQRIWTKDIFSYGKAYQQIDCLLVPLINNEFNRSKSPLKLVECSVTNTGVLCSDTIPYSYYLNETQSIKNAKRVRGFIAGIKRYLNAQDRSIFIPHLTDEGQPFHLETIAKKRIEWFKSL